MPEETQVQTQPQVEGMLPEALPGAETPQVTPPVAEPTPGAETEPKGQALPPAERTYTQAEVRALEGKKDQENAELRKALAYQSLQWEIQQAQAAEASAQAVDKQAVDAGDITPQEATQRIQQRAWQFQQGLAWRQQQEAAHRVMQEGENAGRILAAQNFEAKYGVDPKELFNDSSLSTPERMEIKAVRLALERAQGELKAARANPERFDSGQMGITGRSVDSMTAEEKIKFALEHPQKSTR